MNNSPDTLGQLRRWTVVVLLALLVFLTLIEVADGLFFGDRFHTDPAFYALVGGMISGLFVVEGLAIFRGRNGERRDDQQGRG